LCRAGLYARVSTHDQQTLPLQSRAMREYAARRGWSIVVQVKEVGSGAAERELREKVLDAARRREIDVVLVWRLDRWGRSDSSIKWIGADRMVYRLPVATLSAVLLGPGTTVTHAAMKACADSNTPVCWIGEDGMRFYAFGITPNHDNLMSRKHAAAWADKKKHAEIARRMFVQRFPGVDVQAYSIAEWRGMEGFGYPSSPSSRPTGGGWMWSLYRSGLRISCSA
jgi:hypothetical protein